MNRSGPQLGVAYLSILPTMRGAQKAVEKQLGGVQSERVGRSLGTRLVNGFKGVSTVAMAGVGVALGTALTKGFGRLRAIDQAQAKLRGLGNDSKTVEQVMKNATTAVKGTAFGLDEAATAAAGAMAAGVKPGKDLERNLTLVADAATIAGVGMGDMGAIFNKAAASNKVQMDVINQLHDAGVPALSFLAKTMGVTAEEASKMASAGKIDFATFQNAMEQGLGGAAQSSGTTFSGAMANVLAALGRVGANILGGIFPKLAPMFQSIQAALGPVEDQAARFGEIIGSRVSPMIDRFVQLLEGGTSKLAEAKALLAPLGGAMAALGASGLAPLVGMVPGLGGLAGALGRLGGPLGIAAGIFAGLVATSPELQSALSSLLGSVSTLAQALAPAISEIATIAVGALLPALEGTVTAIAGVVNWAASAVAALAPWSDLLVSLGIAVGGVVLAFKAWTIAGNTLRGAMAIWRVAQSAWIAASYGAAGASYAVTAATKGQALAAGLAAGAQRVLNAVMRANPLGLIITAVTAVVGALTWFFTKTETGKKIWAGFVGFLREAWANITDVFQRGRDFVVGMVTAVGLGAQLTYTRYIQPVFQAIATAAKWLFETILQPIFNVFAVSWAIMWGAAVGIYEAILKPIFSAIGGLFSWLWSSVISVVVGQIKTALAAWGAAVQWLQTTVLQPVMNAIGAAWNWISAKVIRPVVFAIQVYIRQWAAIFQWLNTNVIRPVMNAIGVAIRWVYNSVIVPIGLGIRTAINAVGAVFRWLYANAVKPAIDGVASVFRWVHTNVIAPVWRGIRDTIKGVWTNGIKPVIDTLVKIIKSDPKKAFEIARDGIGTAWKGIQNLAKKPVKFVVNTVINGLIDTINEIPGVKLSRVSLPKGFSHGGIIPGYDSVKRDTVLTPMRKGEGVLVPEVVRGLGRSTIDAMNAAGNYGGVTRVRAQFGKGLARGGYVTPLPSGSYSVSQPFHSGHNGIDLAAPTGTKVMAAAAGRVTHAGWEPGGSFGGGNQVNILHAGRVLTWYAHLSSIASRVSKQVRKGETIGRVGSTGNSTGPHLHYMIETGYGGSLGSGNWINPAPYMTGHTTPTGGDGGWWNPLDGLVNWAAGKINGAFPGGGMWVDVAANIAKQTAESAVKHFTSFIGKDDTGSALAGFGAPLLYDDGGILQPGLNLVQNKTRSPEAVFTIPQLERLVANNGGQMPENVTLQIVDQDGTIVAVIDSRINKALRPAGRSRAREELGV